MGLALLGCGPSEDETLNIETRKFAFEGQPDPALAGTYKTKDGTVYVLEKDGDFRFDGKTSTPSGVRATHGEGVWARKDDRLLFKDANGVVPYNYVLKGKDLTLSLTGKMKNETVFTRQ